MLFLLKVGDNMSSIFPTLNDANFVKFLADFKLYFTLKNDSTFDNVTDEQFLAAYIEASAIFKACNLAFIYLVAHILYMGILTEADGTDGGGYDFTVGEATSESVGDASIQFKTQTDGGNDVYYTHTKYGQQFLVLRGSCASYVISPRTYPSPLVATTDCI